MLTLTNRRVIRVERDPEGDFSVPAPTMSSALRLPRRVEKPPEPRRGQEPGRGRSGRARWNVQANAAMWRSLLDCDGVCRRNGHRRSLFV